MDLLWQVACLSGADRCAVVWLDEYGPGLAHPHTLLDLATDHPRRFFSPSPLRSAWETSVPGLLDIPNTGDRREKFGNGVASSCSISLGSDGPRSWFLVADSLTPRPPLSPETAGELMFLAGEVASVVLHRDLDTRRTPLDQASSGDLVSPNSRETDHFSAWPVLKDLEGRQRGDAVSRRIGDRFLVARVVRGLVEDDLVADHESLDQQVRSLRLEVERARPSDDEEKIWDRVLRATTSFDFEDLTGAVLEWGRIVEGQGHLNGAQEILSLAYDLAKHTGASGQAADAARFLGKLHRTKARWDEAFKWYGIARGVAEETGKPEKLAAVLDGLANAHRDRGNLPRARKILGEVLEIGEKAGNRYAKAIGHHDLMTVEKQRGDLLSAIQHGWMAVQNYDARDGRLRALFDLAGVLREKGELSAAWDAYLVVSNQVEGLEAQVLSLDALAFVAALRGDKAGHDLYRDQLDSIGWQRVSPVYRGQVLYYRGLSCRALANEEEARTWLTQALTYAEEHGLNKLVFDAEAALDGADPAQSATTASQDAPSQELHGVRAGLRDMREALLGVGEPD